MKKNKKQALADSLNSAINPKPKSDLSANVRDLLKDYRNDSSFNTESQHQKTLDSQKDTTQLSKGMYLDSQNTVNKIANIDNTGYPNNSNLDILIADKPVRIAKKETPEAIKLSKTKTLDSQNKLKTGKWGKYDKSRNRKGIFLRTDDDLTKQFKMFCIDNDLEFSQATELAWKRFMESLDSQAGADLAIKIAHDDRRLMINWKTKGHIINLYLRYNTILNAKTKWTVRDDEKSFQLNEVDSRVIELGIIQTQFQKNFKGKINSFSYYLNEIDNFNELGMSGEVLDTMLKINRQRWQQATGKTIDYKELALI
jgi:hypothetical protein